MEGYIKEVSKLDPYAVKQVRGPYLVLPPHEQHCATEEELKEYCDSRRAQGKLLAADLFAGAGGLSLGLTEAGIEVVFGVDHYDYAVETHSHQFPGMSVSWDLSNAEHVERVANLMLECGIEVLAGGPPCQPFSKAGRSGIRYLVENGERDPHDARRDLWRAYLEVVQLARPRAVIMENVPDMALDNEMFIIRNMIEELEQIGYSVSFRVVDAWRYGVPQFRQRLILVALRDNLVFEWPEEATSKVTVWNAIGDMPEVIPGWRPEGGADGWTPYEGPKTEFQHYIRRRVPSIEQSRLYDHITRPVREDDRIAFEMMTSETKYSDLPEHLRRYRSDIFDDKYKRLDENDLSRTITAHIAKDGYGYIHPRESRTLTVREAARLQTFPDDFRFAGPPSAAFKQIGNAVPPRLGSAIAGAVLSALEANVKKPDTSRGVAKALATWFNAIPARDLMSPWAKSGSRWKAVVAEILLERAAPSLVRMLWPLIDSLPEAKPGQAIPEETLETIYSVFSGREFANRVQRLKDLVREMVIEPSALWEPRIDRDKLPTLTPALINYLELAVPTQNESGARSEEPVITVKGVLRVTSRYQGFDTETRNRQSEGRLSIARMLSMNPDSRAAHLGLFELARTVCTPESPRCSECPIEKHCKRFGVDSNQTALEI